MFRGWLVVAAMLAFFGAAATLGVLAVFRARRGAARLDASAVAILAVVMSAVAIGWAPVAGIPLGVVLAGVFAWFAARTFDRKGRPEGAGRFRAIYGTVVTVLSGWVLLTAAADGGSVSDNRGHELGAILLGLMGALLMVFAAAGWLLGTFAVPPESKSRPVAPLTGLREALLAAGLAVAFFAIS